MADTLALLYSPVLLARDFLEAGGPVLTVIAVVTFLMWALILERLWYKRSDHPAARQAALDRWRRLPERSSREAHSIKRMLVANTREDLEKGLLMIRTLVAVCPLLGLLGTVTGMIEVFDVMAVSGNGNARAMAAGVGRATIPTMAGMVAALSGLLVVGRLERHAEHEGQALGDRMSYSASLSDSV